MDDAPHADDYGISILICAVSSSVKCLEIERVITDVNTWCSFQWLRYNHRSLQSSTV